MQWHPLFVYFLRQLVQSHFEVRTEQPVGELPRKADVVLLHKTAAGPAPFRGLWSRLTTWNVLEYKGPTVSARFDELHDLLELGLGVHRHLNELQAKAQQPAVGYAEVSFWYLVNHLGRRFLAELPTYLPDVRQVTEGIWQACVFAHPVLLVSVEDVKVERDSMALHVLAGVPEAERGIITEVLKAEPALRASYGPWLARHEPAIWQEIMRMATEQQEEIDLDFSFWTDYLRKHFDLVDLQSLLQVVGTERLWAALSPEQREELRRLAQLPASPPPTEQP